MEFLVIVAGIMVSFLLNEWRQERQDRRKELSLLTNLRSDLVADSLALMNEISDLDLIIDRGRTLQDLQVVPSGPDSLAILLTSCAAYSVIPTNDITYVEIRSNGSAALIHDRGLLREMIELYDVHQRLHQEYQDVDKWQVLERTFPYLESRIFLADPDPQDYLIMMNDVHWKNLLNNGIAFKMQMRSVLEEHIERIDALTRRIDLVLTEDR